MGVDGTVRQDNLTLKAQVAPRHVLHGADTVDEHEPGRKGLRGTNSGSLATLEEVATPDRPALEPGPARCERRRGRAVGGVKPHINFDVVLVTLKELPAVDSASKVLCELRDDGMVGHLAAAAAAGDPPSFYIECLTVTASIAAVATYKLHVKSELWVDVLSKSVKLPDAEFVPLWEMTHTFPGHAASGSSRSDFAAMTMDANNQPFPFLIAEF
ncbi:hypothetical protein HDU86_006784 [Geranomyces michiganensis]|nr:hypothetical protein HDU86_006784 [Geranomyces michiganensis]